MKNLGNKKWFLLERSEGFDLFQSYPIANAISKNKKFSHNFNCQLKNIAIVLDKHIDICCIKKEWDSIAEKLFNKFKNDQNILGEINKKILIFSKELDSFNNKIINKKESFSFGEALKYYELFLNKLSTLYAWSMFYEFLELGERKYLTVFLGDILNSHSATLEENKDEYFRILTASTKLSWAGKEEIDFLKLIRLAEAKKNVDGLIEKHKRKYFWIPSIGSFQTWNKSFFSNKLAKYKGDAKKELDQKKKVKKQQILKINKAEKKLRLTQKEKRLFGHVREISFLKDYRRGVQNKAFLSVYLRLFPVLAGGLSLKKNNLRWLTIEEIKKGNISEKEITSRSKNCYYLIEDGKKSRVISGKNRTKLFRELLIKKKIFFEGSLRGQVVYKGEIAKIKGRIKIISVKRDIKKMNRGDILVSYMTNPNIVEAISKARAIITDMGGLTCHASIIARELKKPCIIGTKIATQVLKDGDLVEVDANKGIVKILKRNSEKN